MQSMGKCLAPAKSLGEMRKGITLSWKDINVTSAPVMKGPCSKEVIMPSKKILHNVNGFVKPGTLLAIMGSSGAGKSSLLNVLNSRNRGTLDVEGDVRVNSQVIDEAISLLSAYVQQDDLFIPTLTVKEQMWFQAELKMGRGVTARGRKERVHQVMFELGLNKCASTMIGRPGITKGISGGERKRLAFAIEILTDPALLFCDEPTSGLDAYMAQSIVISLKGLAAKGKTIVCTIHQPSSQTFAMFDDLLLMAEGRVAFLGKAKDAFTFFERNGYPCPQNFNPADHFIHTLAVVAGREDECRANCKRICDAYEATEDYREMIMELKPMHMVSTSTTVLEEVQDFQEHSQYKAKWYQQVHALMWRSWIDNIRDPMVFKSRLTQTLVISFMLGVVYFQLEINQKGVMNVNGALFLLQLQITFGNMFAVINTFPMEFPILAREHHNGLYRVDIYYICKVITEFHSFLFLPIIFSSISYWMIGFQPTLEAFLIHMAVMVLICNISIAFGYVVSSCTSNVAVALSITPIVMIPLVMFGGFFLNSDSVPFYFKWMQYLSWFNYANELLVVNQWKDIDTIDCEYLPDDAGMAANANLTQAGMMPGNGSMAGLPSNGSYPNVTQPSNATLAAMAAASRCFTEGAHVIDAFSYTADNCVRNWAVLGGMLGIYRFLAFFLLFLRTRRVKFAKPKPVGSCVPSSFPDVTSESINMASMDEASPLNRSHYASSPVDVKSYTPDAKNYAASVEVCNFMASVGGNSYEPRKEGKNYGASVEKNDNVSPVDGNCV